MLTSNKTKQNKKKINMKISQINALNGNDPIIRTELMVQSNDGSKVGGTGKKVTNYTLCDDTGASISAGMFGNENGNYQSGQWLSIRSALNSSGAPKGVLVNEFKGKKSITVFDNAIVSPVSQGAQDSGFQSPPPTTAPTFQAPTFQAPSTPSSSGDASLQELAAIWTRAYTTYKAALIAAGVDPNEAAHAAQGAPGFTAQFWFGKDRTKIQGL